ncbi:MAG: hypothetical protein AVDCRST_MAG73-4165 [uncultured Thermomicrobiales bacterium]|uniref:Uncharacterized protein n=1 Tax=uncultured Thermomicrobiales bacterium TaxID=1645740 RepID=A0A6J4V112_9BACT|nr:MAG: hypothetical protein AVDCRST_MAG73-4165 [uncultured Thermomicrobiales bacterium]
MPTYVQPIAQHRDHPERLLLRGADGRIYVWSGDDPAGSPREIDRAVARWMLAGARLRRIPGPRVWFHAADLPLADAAATVSGDGAR